LPYLDGVYNSITSTIGGVAKASAIRNTTWNMTAYMDDGTVFNNSTYFPSTTSRLSLPSHYEWQAGRDTGGNNSISRLAEPLNGSLGDAWCRAKAGGLTDNSCLTSGVIDTAVWTRSARVVDTNYLGNANNQVAVYAISSGSESLGYLPAHVYLPLRPVMWLSNSVNVACEGQGNLLIPMQLTTASGADCWDSALVSHTVPTTMRVGSAQTFSITIRNTGVAVWKSGQTVRVRSPETTVSNEWSLVSAYITSDVQPNGTYTFTYSVNAPTTAGTYVLRQTPVWENVSWIPSQTDIKFSQDIVVTNDDPVLNLTSPTANTHYNASGNMSLAGTVTDLDTQTLTIQYQIDSQAGAWTTWTTTTTPANAKTLTAGSVAVGSLAEGTHTLYVRVSDGLTYSTVTSRTFYVDKTSPSLGLSNAGGDLTNITVQDSLAGLASLRYAWEQTGDDYVGSGVSGVSATTCSGGENGAGLFTGLSGSKNLLTSSDMMPPDEGYWRLYVCAVDSVGNIGYVSEGFHYELWLDLNIGDVGFTISGGSGTGLGYTVASVGTNSKNGYSLSLESAGSELVCKDNGSYVIPSIATDGALVIDSAGGKHGAWGWSVVPPSGAWTGGVPDVPNTNAWRTVPFGTSAVMGSFATRPPSAGHNYGLYFGTIVDMGQAACVYEQTLTVSLVANI
jgi:hypothetical protein